MRRIKCEYCGRTNSDDELDCRGCGAGLPDSMIYKPPEREVYRGRQVFNGFNSTVMILCSSARFDSDGTMFYIGDTDYYGYGELST